jgi:hypothetical protein
MGKMDFTGSTLTVRNKYENSDCPITSLLSPVRGLHNAANVHQTVTKLHAPCLAHKQLHNLLRRKRVRHQ